MQSKQNSKSILSILSNISLAVSLLLQNSNKSGLQNQLDQQIWLLEFWNKFTLKSAAKLSKDLEPTKNEQLNKYFSTTFEFFALAQAPKLSIEWWCTLPLRSICSSFEGNTESSKWPTTAGGATTPSCSDYSGYTWTCLQ